MKPIVFVLVATVACALAIGSGTSRIRVKSSSKALPPTASGLRTVVDGEVTPNKIPDHVAFSLLFGIISGRVDDADRQRGRAFIKRMGLDDSQIDQLIAAGEEFRARSQPFLREGHRIKARNHPNHVPLTQEETKRLKQLQKQKDDLTDEIAASLELRLGRDGSEKVRQFVKNFMKGKIKIKE